MNSFASPKVSVIMPVYNGERHLAEALQSLKSQTFKDFECICIDDGGTDSSAAIVEGFAEDDSRFRLIRQGNHGVATTRNRGLDESHGEYISFLDQDDALVSTALERMLHAIETSTPKCDLVSAGIYDFYGDDEPPIPEKSESHIACSNTPINDFFAALANKQAGVNVWGKLYRREALAGIRFPDDVFGADDYVFSSRVFQKISAYVYIDEPLYLYRMHQGNVTTQMPMRYIMGTLRSREIVWAEVCANSMIDAKLRRKISADFAYDIMSWAIKKTCRRRYSIEEMAILREYARRLMRNGVLHPVCMCDRLKCHLFLAERCFLLRLLFPAQFRHR